MESTNKFSASPKTLAFASAMSSAVLLAIWEQRAAESAWLKEFASALAAGDAQLGIFIRRYKNDVYLSTAALPASEQTDPFKDGPRLIMGNGPAVRTLEEFQAIRIIDRAKRH